MEARYLCQSCKQELSEKEAVNRDPDCPQCGEKMVSTDPEPDGDKKSTLKITAFVILILVVAAAGVLLRSEKKYSSPDIPLPDDSARIVDSLLESARTLNQKTPFMVDNSTQLNEIVVGNKTITYKNTLVNLTAEDQAREDVFKKNVKQFLAEKYCSDKKTSKGLKAGIVYGHDYSGRDGTLLFSASISIEDCQK